MDAAVLHDDFEDLAGLVLEEAVVRQHDCCASAGLEYVHDVLDEIELFVPVSMVKSSRSGAWFAPLVPNGGLVSTTVVSLCLGPVRRWCRRGRSAARPVQIQIH